MVSGVRAWVWETLSKPRWYHCQCKPKMGTGLKILVHEGLEDPFLTTLGSTFGYRYVWCSYGGWLRRSTLVSSRRSPATWDMHLVLPPTEITWLTHFPRYCSGSSAIVVVWPNMVTHFHSAYCTTSYFPPHLLGGVLVRRASFFDHSGSRGRGTNDSCQKWGILATRVAPNMRACSIHLCLNAKGSQH